MTGLIPTENTISFWKKRTFSSTEKLKNVSNLKLYCNKSFILVKAGENLNGTIEGYKVYNYSRYTATVPYRIEDENIKFDFSTSNPFFTSPPEGYKEIITSGSSEYHTGDRCFFNETENAITEENRLFVVIKLKDNNYGSSKFYKIEIIDSDNYPIKAIRNSGYEISIIAMPYNNDAISYNSYEEAKNGVAANNLWVSIEQPVGTLTDDKGRMMSFPDGTNYIFTHSGKHYINFLYKNNVDESSKITVKTLDNINYHSVKIKSNYSGATGNFSSEVNHSKSSATLDYLIEIDMKEPDNKLVYGMFEVRAGKMVRRILIGSVHSYKIKEVNIQKEANGKFTMYLSLPKTEVKFSPKWGSERLSFYRRIDLNTETLLKTQLETCKYMISYNGAMYERNTGWNYKYVDQVYSPIANDGEVKAYSLKLNYNITSCPIHGCTYLREKSNHVHIFFESPYFLDEEMVCLLDVQAGEEAYRHPKYE